ncbi:MAG: hypothetical protein KDK70_17795 [Myxococcales bacterium]|nr:hypothetical protein [Myxococcales bacterium]
MIGWILGLTSVVGGCATRPDAGDPRRDGLDSTAEPSASARGEVEPEADPTEAPRREPDAAALEGSSEAGSEASAPAQAEAEPEPVVAEAAGSEDADAGPLARASLVTVPDANISIHGVEADGQRLDELACQASNLPLFGSLAVVASIAEQKRALDRCAPGGGAVAVTWTFRGGKARDVTVEHASSSRTGACVAKAMQKVVAPFEARCGAVVLLGDPTGADRALAELRAAAGR